MTTPASRVTAEKSEVQTALGRNPGVHFWVHAPKPAGAEVWPHDWDVMWWDGEYFWGTNGDGYKADSLVVGPKATAPEEQVASLHAAAAPDLLAALKLQIAYEAAVSGSDGHSRATWMELVKARDAAIAKAEGRS